MTTLEIILVSSVTAEFILIALLAYRDFIYMPARYQRFDEKMNASFEAGRAIGWNEAVREVRKGTSEEKKTELKNEQNPLVS